FGLTGLAALGVFALVELRVPYPMIDVRLFRDKLFTAANSVQIIAQGGLQGALFLLPLFLQAERGMSPLESGLTTFPQAIGVVMMVQPAGRFYKSIGPRRMMMAGMAGITLSTAVFYWVDLDTSAWLIRLVMLARGWSFALTLVPLQAATFATIKPQDTGRASAIFNSSRQVAASFGVALLGTVLTNRMAHHGSSLGSQATLAGGVTAFQEAFLAAAALGVIGVFAALLIDDRAAAATMERIPIGREGTAQEAESEAIAAAVH